MGFWGKIVDAPTCGRWCAGMLFVGIALLGFAAPAAASPAVPYHDPSADGYIGLCNAQGHQITSGSVDTAPFAFRAVSSTPAHGPYAGATRTAVLLAYQPIDGLAPSDWSGDQLTAATRYSNTANPMAAATAADESLAGFMTEFSPKWDGILELRMYLDAANQDVYSLHYPALDIKVTGKTWHALDGGQVNCKAGTAESIESILLPSSKHKTPLGSSSSAPTSGVSSAGRAGNATTNDEANAGAKSSSGTTVPHTGASDTHNADHIAEWAGLAALLAVAFGIVLLLVRSKGRRKAADTAPAAISDPLTNENADRVPVMSKKGSTP
jgi:hypothetical protein